MNPKSQEVNKEVRTLVARALRRTFDEVPGHARFDSLGIDSMAMIEINVSLEEHFRFSMPDMASPKDANLTTIEDLVKLVERELEKAEAKRKKS